MDEETQKIIQEQMEKVPEDIMMSIVSVDYQTKMQEIIKRQRLMIDQVGKLEMETTLVMIGLEPMTDYVENIQRELEISIMRAKEIAMDVSENIFKPIRESLEKMNTEQEDEENINASDELEREKEKSEQTIATETDLDRDQILNEIENPSLISGGTGTMNFSKNKQPEVIEKIETETTDIAIKTPQDIEIIPGQVVKDVTNEKPVDIFKDKMTATTITSQQIINAKPETKLPEIEKKRPTSGVDAYREPLI
jgi:hypothetical protein